MFSYVMIIFARLAITTAPTPAVSCDELCAEAYSYYVNGGGK